MYPPILPLSAFILPNGSSSSFDDLPTPFSFQLPLVCLQVYHLVLTWNYQTCMQDSRASGPKHQIWHHCFFCKFGSLCNLTFPLCNMGVLLDNYEAAQTGLMATAPFSASLTGGSQ